MKAPGTRFHALRVAGRALAAGLASSAQLARIAAGDGSCTHSAIAKRFALTDHSAVGPWFDAASGKAIAFGDVLALPRSLARDILLRALGALEDGEGPSTRDTLDRIGIELGHGLHDYLDDLRDGTEDELAKHEANLVRVATVALRGVLAIQRRRGER